MGEYRSVLPQRWCVVRRWLRLLPASIAMLWSCCACAPPYISPPPHVTPPPVAPQEKMPQQVAWSALPGWQHDDHDAALVAFRTGCQALRYRPDWQAVCAQLTQWPQGGRSAREFFEAHFDAWALFDEHGQPSGLITGYYVPDLKGSRHSSSRYPYPVYARPADLLVIDFSSLYPELAAYPLRGRLDGQRVVPYWSREQIDGLDQPLHGQELFWVSDPVALFYLHIQGSGRITLEDGEQVLINYAEQNGHPFRSIGRLLEEQGIMSRDQMSMSNIAAWGRDNPLHVQRLLNENPSYIFFRTLPPEVVMPSGAMGVPLTAERSLAVDPRHIPLGAPVFVETRRPPGDQALQRLMVAQDSGGAIKGRVRGDFFWGIGDAAGHSALRTRFPARMWLLLPRGMQPEALKR